jgi:hypothetical protein
MNEPWAVQRVQLKFLFGGIRLGSAGFEAAVLPRAVEAPPPGAEPTFPLSSFPTEVRVIQTPSHPISGRLRRFQFSRHAIRYVPHQYRRYSLDLQGQFDDYLRTFSSKSRFTLRKKLRKFAERFGGTIPWRLYRTPDEILEFHTLARQVSERTYQERLLDAGLPAHDEFRERLRDAAERDAVRGFLLFDGDKPIAYLCCLIKGGVVAYDYVGHDHEYHDSSPGIVLLYSALEELHREGSHRMFDFTEGEGQLKEVFSRSSTECADIYYFRWSASSILVLALHSALDLSSSAGAWALRVLGIKPVVKRAVRGLAGRIAAARSGWRLTRLPECAEGVSR